MTRDSTGAANGRVGGRLGGGSRARTALSKTPRVRVVGAVPPAALAALPAVPSAREPLEQVQMDAASSAITLMGAALNLTPTRMAQAAQVAMAAVAASQAARAAGPAHALAPTTPAVSTKAQGKRRLALASASQSVVSFPRTKARPVEVTPALGAGRRGSVLVVQPAAEYGAGKTYDWNDAVAGRERSGALTDAASRAHEHRQSARHAHGARHAVM